MYIPWYKRYLSYLFDLRQEVTSSEWNDHLEVLVSKGRFQLCSANAIYSFEDLYDNYYQSFEQLIIREGQSFEKVLVLGLGLGSIPSMLEKQFGQEIETTAVEIDEEVVRLAHQYVLDELLQPITIYTTDAINFVGQHEGKFDLICIDLFVDDVIPNKFQTLKFLQEVGDLCKDNGMIMYNRLYRTESDKEATQEFFENVFKRAFPNARNLDLKDNWMLLNR